MSLHLITGHLGQEHITAADHASFNVSVFGKENFVFERGNRFKAETISNNLIRILDGDLMIQGRHVRLAENTYEELQIENGTQGMYRYDCIVARYTKDAATGIEKCEFVVVKGEENAVKGQEPELMQGDITEQGNDLVTDYLLYRVELEGINIVTVRKMFRTKNLLQNAIVPTYKKIILNQQGWHRIAQIKFDSANKANGSLGNNCEIEISRSYMNGRNEFHKIQLVSLFNTSKFQNERSNGVDAHYITKIRHVVDTNTNTTYLEIYYNASSENQPVVTLSNHMNFDNMFWEIIEPELTAETVDGVTVLGSHDFSLNYDVQTQIDTKVGKVIYSPISAKSPTRPIDLLANTEIEIELRANGLFLMTIFNSFGQSSVYLVESAANTTVTVLTKLKGDTAYFKVASVSNRKIKITSTQAQGYITFLYLGGTS